MTLMLIAAVLALAVSALAAPDAGNDRTALEPIPGVRWRLEGELGRRVERNTAQWLLRAPEANPGILDMFRRRDRHQPYERHTPWAGEFAGKYLISAVQAIRLTGDARLRAHTESFVRDLIATQDADGYLGPWPRDRRLLGECDLWGHYHCMFGLLLWADDTGDRQALEAVHRAAEAICRVYVDTDRRPIQAGNPCFNLSVLHVMAELYRRTGSARYLAFCQRVVEDLPADGDWFRKGVEGVPYWQLPGSGPRWEALHILQGLLTLWRATGDVAYRDAVLNHWRSIRDLDRHPSGAFSTDEQASGTIFARGSIETCCSVAWMALCCDILQLTGDAAVADELELTLWNEALAAQHPSGSWWTYDTPLNGVRVPSYQHISFQYRPGSPELNCCSVNGPRMLGALPEWAVLRKGDAVYVNFYGPSSLEVPLAGGALKIAMKTRYPVDGEVRIGLDAGGRDAEVALRIPGWSRRTQVSLNGRAWPEEPHPGTYLHMKRRWKKGDVVTLRLDMSPRVLAGGGPDRGGHVAIHRGPLLLAVDAGRNERELADLAPLDARALRLEPMAQPAEPTPPWRFPAMGLWRLRLSDGSEAVLCDFASAGALGTEYAAWIRAVNAPPAPARLMFPEDGAVGRPGPVLFRWIGLGSAEDRYHLVVGRDPDFRRIVASARDLPTETVTVSEGLEEAGDYWWKVVTENAVGSTENACGPRHLRVDPSAAGGFPVVREDGCMLAAAMDGSPEPQVGSLGCAAGVEAAVDRFGRENGAVTLNGRDSGIRYRLPYFPEWDYTFMAWVKVSRDHHGMGQVCSAWRRGMDDPLRVTVENGEVSARMEAGTAYRTPGVRVEPERWFHVAAVKEGALLRLYVDGRVVASAAVPERIRTVATDLGVGFNPFFAGGERLSGCVDDCAFYARALAPEEIRKAFEARGSD